MITQMRTRKEDIEVLLPLLREALAVEFNETGKVNPTIYDYYLERQMEYHTLTNNVYDFRREK